MISPKSMIALFALSALSAGALQSFTAEILLINWMGEPITFSDCYSSHQSTIQDMPTKGSVLKPGETAKFVVNASHVLEELTGQCWWDTPDHFDCFKNGTGPNGTTPKKPGHVTSCPYISWVRGVDIKSKSFGGSWDFGAPYEAVDHHWEQPGVTHKRYCACSQGVSKEDCAAKCANPPTPAPAPGPQPSSHYTNPKTGCASDETRMITDDKTGAAICAPRCVKSGGILPKETCAKDVPSGVTAEPSCDFIDWETDIKYCALNCRVDPKHKMLCASDATCFESVVPDPLNPNTTTVQGYCGYNQTA